MTIVGSSNFGYRSVYRDIEAQLVIYSDNQQLQDQLHNVSFLFDIYTSDNLKKFKQVNHAFLVLNLNFILFHLNNNKKKLYLRSKFICLINPKK